MAGAVTLGLSLPAGADPTCYTGCGPGPQTVVGSGPSTSPGLPGPQTSPEPVPAPKQSVPSSGGLPLTGGDIEQSAGIAAVLLVAGAAMVRVNRRRVTRAP
jgi:LPXTG-motif cell wall-anchored protein